jgi:hypothetical protein
MKSFTHITYITTKYKKQFPCVTVPGWLIGEEEDIICTHESCWKNPSKLNQHKQTILQIQIHTETTTG